MGKQSADADKRVCDKNNSPSPSLFSSVSLSLSLSKASSQEDPKYQYPFLLDIVFFPSQHFAALLW